MKTETEWLTKIVKGVLIESLNFHDLVRKWDQVDNVVKIELCKIPRAKNVYKGWVTANGEKVFLPSLVLIDTSTLRIQLSPIVCGILGLINEKTDWNK